MTNEVTGLNRGVAIIRAQARDSDAKRLIDELAPAFSDHVYIISEKYSDPSFEVKYEAERHIVLGGGFLQKFGLPYFDRVGWQCGDFIYYAALNYLPEFDYLWMVEADVSLRFDVEKKFDQLNTQRIDLLLPHFGRRGDTWGWTQAMADSVPLDQVFGGLFPVSRITRAAIAHLLEQRQAYSAQPKFGKLGVPGATVPVYANDESFCATILKRDGFTCEDLFEHLNIDCSSFFSLNLPVDPAELPFIKSAIVHPVCLAPKSLAKCQAAFRLEGGREKLQTRRDTFVRHLGSLRWREFSGLPDSVLQEGEFQVVRETAQFFLLKVVREMEVLKEQGLISQNLNRAWIYDDQIGVLDFKVGQASFALDLVPQFDGSGFFRSIEVKVAIRNQDARDLLDRAHPDLEQDQRVVARLQRVETVARVCAQIAAVVLRFCSKIEAA